MTTLLLYLVFAAIIGLVIFFLAVLVFGRGEQMAPLDPRTSPAQLPESDITSEDVRKVRFSLALRGYRMSDVDWTLERISDQLDLLRAENVRLREGQESVATPETASSADVYGSNLSYGDPLGSDWVTASGPGSGSDVNGSASGAGSARDTNDESPNGPTSFATADVGGSSPPDLPARSTGERTGWAGSPDEPRRNDS